MEQYFKIGEISQLYGIGVDSLRYYEKLGLIHPVRSESGYRLYSMHDLWCLNVIRDLRGLDFSMEQIHDYLAGHTVASTLTLLEQESNAILQKMQALEKLHNNVEQRMQTIRAAEQQPVDVFEIKQYPTRRCFSIREEYTNDEEMDILIKRLLNYDKSRFYIIGNNQIGSTIPLAQAQKGSYKTYNSTFILDTNGDCEMEAGDYLCISYRGNCKRNAYYIPALFAYAKEHNLTLTGDILELLWIDIHISADPEEQMIELQVRVQPK